MHPDLIPKTPRKRVFIIATALMLACLLWLKIVDNNPTDNPAKSSQPNMPAVELLAQSSPAPQPTPQPSPRTEVSPVLPPPSTPAVKPAHVATKKTDSSPAKVKTPKKSPEQKAVSLKSVAPPAEKPVNKSTSTPKKNESSMTPDPSVADKKMQREQDEHVQAALEKEKQAAFERERQATLEQARLERLRNIRRNPSPPSGPPGPPGPSVNNYEEALGRQISAKLHGRLGNTQTRLVVTAHFDATGKATDIAAVEPNKGHSPMAAEAEKLLRDLKIQNDSTNPVPSSMQIILIVEGRGN